MMHLNSIWLEGNLVSEPQIVHQPEDHTCCFLRVASTRMFRGEKEFSIFNIELHSDEVLQEAQSLERGQGVRIIGRLCERRFATNQGVESQVTIIAELVEKRPRFIYS